MLFKRNFKLLKYFIYERDKFMYKLRYKLSRRRDKFISL